MTLPFPESPDSSDLKGPCDDLICPEQLNVLTGLVFEEGGELSQELPFVCRNKYNRASGCGDSWLNTQSLFHGFSLILVSLSPRCLSKARICRGLRERL